MSELKVYHCNEWHNEYTEFYIKSEADKMIADLEEKTKQYKVLYQEKCRDINNQERFFAEQLYHHKYKRCLAMAKWCDAMKSYFNESGFFDVYANERTVFYERWYNRWLKIAEQFKDKEPK